MQAASKPSRPSVSLVKRSKTQAKIKIKKRGKATGYQIAVKTSKKARYRIVMPTKKRTVVLRKLKASKVYYVKVRAFRTKGYRIVHGKGNSNAGADSDTGSDADTGVDSDAE